MAEHLYDLFVVSNESNSRKALQIYNSSGNNTCKVRDLRQMKEIPEFLKGVPSLYIRRSKLIMTGTQCLQFLQSLETEQATQHMNTQPLQQQQQQQPSHQRQPLQQQQPSQQQVNVPQRKSNFVSKATPREYSDEKITSIDLEKIMRDRKNQLQT